MDGFELLREVRKHASRTQTGAIVVSGHAPIRAAARRLAESLGISKVLPIDIDRPALREAIDSTLRENSATRVSDAETPVARADVAEPQLPGIDDLLQTVVLEAGRRFRVPIAVAYVKIGEHEHLRAQVTLADLSKITGGRAGVDVPAAGRHRQ